VRKAILANLRTATSEMTTLACTQSTAKGSRWTFMARELGIENGKDAATLAQTGGFKR
jgi:hypothetical protein